MKKEDLEKLAKLSRLELEQGELDGFARDFDSILEYVSEIKEAVSGKEVREDGFIQNVFRADSNEHAPGTHTEALLKNAPDKSGDYVKVRQVFE